MLNKFAGESYIENQSFSEPGYLTGTVKWFDQKKGFGFLIADDRTGDIFVHINQLKKSGILDLREGDRVRFAVEEYKDRKQAASLELI